MAKSSSKLGKKLAKAVVKAVKAVAKSAKDKTSKTPVKSSGKEKKNSKPVTSKVTKPSEVKEPKKTAAKQTKITQSTKGIEKEAKPTKSKKSKASKASKATNKTDELDLGDDLVGDDEMGGEDIPDLAEFEEVEIEVEESEEVTIEVTKESDVTSQDSEQEVILTDAEGRRYCRVRDCDQIASVEAYCRFHYLLLWKKIQVRRKILADGKLERYVEELTSRYPDKFLEMIRKDLKTEKDFLGAIAELEIDESAVDNEFEDESASFIEEVRGMSEGASAISDDDEF